MYIIGSVCVCVTDCCHSFDDARWNKVVSQMLGGGQMMTPHIRVTYDSQAYRGGEANGIVRDYGKRKRTEVLIFQRV